MISIQIYCISHICTIFYYLAIEPAICRQKGKIFIWVLRLLRYITGITLHMQSIVYCTLCTISLCLISLCCLKSDNRVDSVNDVWHMNVHYILNNSRDWLIKYITISKFIFIECYDNNGCSTMNTIHYILKLIFGMIDQQRASHSGFPYDAKKCHSCRRWFALIRLV